MVRARLLMLLAGLATSRPASANVTLLTFEQDGSALSVTSDGTVDATIRNHRVPRACRYALAARELTSIQTSMGGPDVRAALQANAVFVGPPMRLLTKHGVVEWRNAGTVATAPYGVTLLRLELQVQLLKAQLRCPT